MKENAQMREAPKADAPEKSKGFWQTLPGILTGVAALITAVTGLIVGVLQTPLIHHTKNAESEKIGIHARQADDPAGQSAKDVNLLAPENGGHLVLATSPDWRQTTIRKGFGVVGAHDPEEAVYSFRSGAAATLTSFKMLVDNVDPSNVKTFELLVSNDSPTSGFRSIGKFELQNIIAFDDPYQQFKFQPTKARYFKVRLLLNQSGRENPIVIHEFQLLGELDK